MIAEQGKDGDNFKKYMCDNNDLTQTFLEVGRQCRVEDIVIGSEKPKRLVNQMHGEILFCGFLSYQSKDIINVGEYKSKPGVMNEGPWPE